MTRIYSTQLRLATAGLGGTTPLPPLAGDELHVIAPELLPPELRATAATDARAGLLPYGVQDQYDRVLVDREVLAIVLDNGLLRATVLPELGGRLWSLVDLTNDRDLLYRPPAIRFANLGLRNAWFAGGVEWNVGTIGHSPHSCAPLHSGLVEDDDGEQILRLWEFERLREVDYRLELSLPEGSRVLHVDVAIENPNPWAVPMYWWSNSAIPITDNTRVLSPSSSVYRFDYRAVVEQHWPSLEGVDRSYPARGDSPMDYFFRPDDSEQPWVASVDDYGQGMFQASTRRLRGRKLFQWGRGRSGRNWQEFLSGPGREYAEIQAGLAATQLEHLVMPAGSHWAWTETYGALDLPPDVAHDPDGAVASRAAARWVRNAVPLAVQAHRRSAAEARVDVQVCRRFTQGSNWGELHRDLLAVLDGRQSEGTAVETEDVAGQRVHRRLLGAPAAQEDDPVVEFAPGPGWEVLLRREAAEPQGQVPLWWVHLQLGGSAFGAGDRSRARDHWETSVALRDNMQARRGLGRLSHLEHSADHAVAHYLAACRLAPTLQRLHLEAAGAFIDLDRVEAASAILEPLLRMPDPLPRARLLAAVLARAHGDRHTVRALLQSDFVLTDVREGDSTLGDLWRWSMEETRTPLPQRLDFSLTEDQTER